VTKDEALKMAIEVMNNYNDGWTPDEMVGAIKACKEALEQPAWQGLTDDEIGQIIVNSKSLLAIDFYRAIEQTLKEKNHG
jgi:hypothetical protein